MIRKTNRSLTFGVSVPAPACRVGLKWDGESVRGEEVGDGLGDDAEFMAADVSAIFCRRWVFSSFGFSKSLAPSRHVSSCKWLFWWPASGSSLLFNSSWVLWGKYFLKNRFGNGKRDKVNRLPCSDRCGAHIFQHRLDQIAFYPCCDQWVLLVFFLYKDWKTSTHSTNLPSWEETLAPFIISVTTQTIFKNSDNRWILDSRTCLCQTKCTL